MPSLIESRPARPGEVKRSQTMGILEHLEHIEHAENVEITCPCCGTKREEPASVLSNSFNISLARLYSPLNPKKREFRLLTLCSGSFDNEVRCNLVPVSMDSNPSYTALSYCRGSRDERGTISINGQKISVMKSLELALKYLRKGKTHSVIWADALCINQEDLGEKSSQVSMMRDIYAKASNVSIWLGESGNNSDLAMDLVKSIDAIDFDDPAWVADPVEWTAIQALLQRPYWRRLWIVSEVLLAKHATVFCGYKHAPIACFLALYRKSTETRLKPLQMGFSPPYSIILSEYYTLRKLIKHDGIPIHRLLTTTGGLECSLPVDKIFAILSLSTQIDREVMKIDYSQCFRCLITRIAKYNFIRWEACSPLSLLQTHQVDKEPSLPSWVPDYTKHDKEWHLLIPDIDGNVPYSAGGINADWNALGLKSSSEWTSMSNSTKLKIEDRGRFETLVLSGLVVDVVGSAQAAPFTEFYTGIDVEVDARVKRKRREKMRQACKEWEDDVASRLAKTDPYDKTCGRYAAFWRTVIGDRDLTWRGPPSVAWDFESRFEAWMGRGDKSQDDLYSRPYSDAAIIRCIYRSFLVTEKGYLGLGRSHTRAGDILVLLRGGDVPFILRPICNGYYHFIGEAYVHGIMEGSFVRNARKKDVREFRLR